MNRVQLNSRDCFRFIFQLAINLRLDGQQYYSSQINKKVILNTILDRSQAHFIMVGLPGFACTFSEAVQVSYLRESQQLRTLVLVSETEIRSKKFTFLYQSLRMKKINLDLVLKTEIEEELFSISKPEIKCQKILVSMCEIEQKKFPFSSRS